MYSVVRLFSYDDGLTVENQTLTDEYNITEHVCSTEEEIIESCGDADAVIGIFEPLTARVINSLPKLKLIACKSMGWNYVDLDEIGRAHV